MKQSKYLVELLIKIAPTVEEADAIINENYGFETIPEKIAFLRGMFDVEFCGQIDEETYWKMLNRIVYR